jgi:hypothetical protein
MKKIKGDENHPWMHGSRLVAAFTATGLARPHPGAGSLERMELKKW